MELVFCYMTAKDRGEAERIRDRLISGRLAACVNIIGDMDSCFWWEGRKSIGKEVGLIAKTRKSLLPSIVKQVKDIHSYDMPCIVAMPIIGGNKDFLEWVERETTAGKRVKRHGKTM